jgi:hypothetical protein
MMFNLPAVVTARIPVYINGEFLKGVSELVGETVTVTEVTDTHVHYVSGCCARVAKRNKYGFKVNDGGTTNYYFADFNVPSGTVVGRNAKQFLEEMAPFMKNTDKPLNTINGREPLRINNQTVIGVYTLGHWAVILHEVTSNSVLYSFCHAPDEYRVAMQDGIKFTINSNTGAVDYYFEDKNKEIGTLVGNNVEAFQEIARKYS